MTISIWDLLHTDRRHRLRYPSEHTVRFLASLPFRTGAALDIGCGTGRHLKLLRDWGFLAVGVDTSPAAVELTPNSFLGSMLDLPFDDDLFDVAVAFGSFYYGTRSDGVQAVRELHRVLHPGGYGFVVVRTRRDWRSNGVPVGEPEHGLEMHFLDEQDIPVVYAPFSEVLWELAEWTTDGCALLNSDWLITVQK